MRDLEQTVPELYTPSAPRPAELGSLSVRSELREVPSATGYTVRELLRLAAPGGPRYLGLYHGLSPLFRDQILNATMIATLARQLHAREWMSPGSRSLDLSTGTVHFTDPSGTPWTSRAIPVLSLEVRESGTHTLSFIPNNRSLATGIGVPRTLIEQLSDFTEQYLSPLGIHPLTRKSGDLSELERLASTLVGAIAELRGSSEVALDCDLNSHLGTYSYRKLFVLVEGNTPLDPKRLPSFDQRIAFIFQQGQMAADRSLELIRDPLHGVAALAESVGLEARLLENSRSPHRRRVVINVPGVEPRMGGLIAFGSPPSALNTAASRVMIQYAHHFPSDIVPD